MLTLINTTGDSALLRVILQPAQWILAQTALTRTWCYNNLIENLDYKDWGNSQPQLILIYNFDNEVSFQVFQYGAHKHEK